MEKAPEFEISYQDDPDVMLAIESEGRVDFLSLRYWGRFVKDELPKDKPNASA